MNKIYKVVWSKVKNCYVVVSEIAKNVISGSVKSAKVGAAPAARGLALGAMMAFVITGNVWAEGNTPVNNSSYGIEVGNGNSYKNDSVSFNIGGDLDRYVAIHAHDGGAVEVNTLNATVTGGEFSAGAEASGGAVMDLGNTTLNISAADVVGSEAYGINVARQGTAEVSGNLEAVVTGNEWSSGLEAYNGSKITVGNSSSKVELNVTANGEESSDPECGVRAHGIFACGQTENVYEDGEIDEVAYGGSTINVIADQLTVSATSSYGEAYSIFVDDASVVTVNSNTANITGDIYAGKDSKVNITANKAADIVGDIVASGDGSVSMSLNTKDSTFTGATITNGNEKGVGIDLKNGATWYVTGDSTVSHIGGNEFNVVSTKKDKRVTVTIDGTKPDGMNDNYENTISNVDGVNLIIRESEESGLGGNVTINSNSDVTVDGAHHAIYSKNDNVDITADKLTLINGKGYDAIRAENGGNVSVVANSANMTSMVYTSGTGQVTLSATGNVSVISANGNALNNDSTQGSEIKVTGANIDLTSGTGAAIAVGHDIRKTTYNGTVTVGDANTKTVTITGATQDSFIVEDGNNNIINFNEDNKAAIFTQGTVNITATDKVEINVSTDDKKAISAHGGANVTIDGGKQTIINGEINADGFGRVVEPDGDIESQDNGMADTINILIKGKEIIVDADLETEEGVFARGDSTGIDNAVIVVGDVNTEKVTVRDVDTGLFAWNGGSKVEVNSGTLTISADANLNDSAVGICAFNETVGTNKLASVDVNANKTEITVEDGNFAYGIFAHGKSDVNVTGDVDIVVKGTSAFGIEAERNAVVELGSVDSNITFNISANELEYSGESRAEAIAARGENVININGNMYATVNGRDWVSGIESENGSIIEVDNVVLNVSTSGYEFSEASGINVARRGTVKVNGDLEATVTGGEWASGVEAYNGSSINVGNGSSDVKLTASANGNVSKDEDWGVSAFGILSVGQTTPIIADNDEDSEEAYGGSTVNINAAELTVSANSANGLAYGVYAEDKGTVKANGNIDITAYGYSSYGVEALNGSVVELGSASKDVSVIANGSGTNGEAIAVYAEGENSRVDIVADELTVNANSQNKNQPGSSLQVKDGAVVNVVANTADITGMIYATGEDSKVEFSDSGNVAITAVNQNNGISAIVTENATINIEGSLVVNANGAYASGIDAYGEALVNIGSTGSDVNFNITATGEKGDAVAVWGDDGSTINITADEFTVSTSGAETGSLQANGGTVITAVANTADISGVIWAADEGSKVDLTQVGDLKVSDPNGYPVIQADSDGIVIVGNSSTKTNVTGDVYVDNGGGVRMVLGTNDSLFTGSTKVGSNDGAIVLGLYDGATWEVTESSNVSKVSGNNFNIIAAEGVTGVKVTVDGDNHVKAELYEDVYCEDVDDPKDGNTSVVNLKGVDLAIIDEEGGGLEACGQGSKTIINSNSNFEGIFGEVGVEVEGYGLASITAKDVTFTTGEDTIYVYDEVVEVSNVVNNESTENGNSVVSKGVAVIDASGNVNLSSTGGFVLNNDSTQGSEIKVTGANINLTSGTGAAIAVGHDIRKTAYNGIVTVGDEDTETVTIKGKAQELREVYDNGNLINFNEDNRAVVFAQGTVNITATDKVEITETYYQKAIAAYGGADVTIDGGEKTIINGEINADGHEYAVQDDNNIHHQDNDRPDDINILIKGKEIIINGDSSDTQEGVYARGDSSGEDNAVITIGDANTETVTISYVDSGLVARNAGSRIEVNSESFVISANGNNEDSVDGIVADNESNVGDKLACVYVNASKTEITVQDDNFETCGIGAYGKSNVTVIGDIDIVSNGSTAYGVWTGNKAVVNANGNIDITATGYSAYGVEAVNGSIVELGNSDANITFNITSIGTGEAEAQAISAESGSKVTINADKLDINTSAANNVTGSIQARGENSNITVNASEADVQGMVWAGDDAEVVINVTKFAVDGTIGAGNGGVVELVTGDIAYDDNKTKFYTENNGVINLVGGNITGVLNIVQGNVNLAGATFTADDLGKAITGEGKLVVDGTGVLKTTAGQVFTVGCKDTVTTNKDILDSNAISDIASKKVTFKSGSLSLSDDYSYDYLTSITDVMKEDNNNATKLVMTGTLVKSDDIDVEPENDKISADDASDLGSGVELDKVVVEADKNLLIGAKDAEDSKVNAGDKEIQVGDSVENGFSANQLDLGEGSTGVVITGGQEIVLGGSQNDTSEKAHEVITVGGKAEEITIVVGTESKVGDAEETKGTLCIGNSAVKETDKFQLTGKAVVNKDSELHAKGETTITKGVELNDGKVHVDKDAHLKADIKAKGNDNIITGKVTGNLEVDEAHGNTVIHLGNDKKAGKMNAEKSKLNGGTLFLDPAYAKGIKEGSAFALKNADALDGAYIAGQNSTISFGVENTDIAEDVFKKTGLTFGSGTDSNGDAVEADVNAVIYIADTTDVTAGSITANGVLTDATSVNVGTVNFAANSLLMVEAEKVANVAAIIGVQSVNIDADSKLYIDDAVKGETYTIIEGSDASWEKANILTNNQLIKFTDSNESDGKFSLIASIKTVNEVYGNDVIIDKVVDESVDSDSVSSDFFNSAVDEKVNAGKATQIDALNSIGSINELAGVSHTTYAVSNILTDAVADHVSLANAEEHNKDIWAHYVHTKEDVAGLKGAGKYNAQYNGIVVGADLYKEGKATIGAALTYVDGNINGSTLASRTENDAKYYGASIYGSIENENSAVIADVSYLHGEHDITQRNSGKLITGKPESDAFSVGARVEKESKAGIGKLVPYAGMRYMHLGTGNYTNSIGLAYDTEDANLFMLPVGVKYSADIHNKNGWTVRPIAEVGYVWAFGDTDTNQTVSLNGVSNGFGYDVTDSGSWIGLVGVQAVKNDWTFGVSYSYQDSDHSESKKWYVDAKYSF